MLFYRIGQLGQLNHGLHSHSALSLCTQFPRIGRRMCTFIYICLRVSTSVYVGLCKDFGVMSRQVFEKSFFQKLMAYDTLGEAPLKCCLYLL
jgi:hypothetical protein